jgi:hypothetical protein
MVITDLVFDPTPGVSRLLAAVWPGSYTAANQSTWKNFSGGTILLNDVDTMDSAWTIVLKGDNGPFRLAAGRTSGKSPTTVYFAKGRQAIWHCVGIPLNPWKKYATSVPLIAAHMVPWFSTVACKPTDPSVIFAGNETLHGSNNGSYVKPAFTKMKGLHVDMHQVVFDPTCNDIYVATDGGVYLSTDSGKTWNLRSNGLEGSQMYSLSVSQGPTPVLVATFQDEPSRTCSKPVSKMWPHLNTEEGGPIEISNDASFMYLAPMWATDNFQRFKADGSGALAFDKWLAYPTQMSTYKVDVWCLKVSPSDPKMLLGVFGDRTFQYPEYNKKCWVWYSSDGGDHWHLSLPVALPDFARVVAYAPSDASVCYAGTQYGFVARSTAGGIGGWNSPVKVHQHAGHISSLCVARKDPNLIFVGLASGTPSSGFDTSPEPGTRVYRSVDGGATWQNASGLGQIATTETAGQLPDTRVNALAADDNDPATLYAATDAGVFVTTNRGNTWKDMSDLWSPDAGPKYFSKDYYLPRVRVTALVLHVPSNTLFASTLGRGAYRYRLNGFTLPRVQLHIESSTLKVPRW